MKFTWFEPRNVGEDWKRDTPSTLETGEEYLLMKYLETAAIVSKLCVYWYRETGAPNI